MPQVFSTSTHEDCQRWIAALSGGYDIAKEEGCRQLISSRRRRLQQATASVPEQTKQEAVATPQQEQEQEQMQEQEQEQEQPKSSNHLQVLSNQAQTDSNFLSLSSMSKEASSPAAPVTVQPASLQEPAAVHSSISSLCPDTAYALLTPRQEQTNANLNLSSVLSLSSPGSAGTEQPVKPEPTPRVRSAQALRSRRNIGCTSCWSAELSSQTGADSEDSHFMTPWARVADMTGPRQGIMMSATENLQPEGSSQAVSALQSVGFWPAQASHQPNSTGVSWAGLPVLATLLPLQPYSGQSSSDAVSTVHNGKDTVPSSQADRHADAGAYSWI